MKKEKKVWVLTLWALWLLTPNQTNAQQYDSVQTLNEVTITGTRMEQPVIEVPRNVTVITRENIQRSVYNSVGDLLAAEAGLYIIGAGQTPGTNQSLFLRGASSNQVVVMIDGSRISDPSSPNGAVDLSELSLTDIERVEIIRGSHSTLFGGSAIGGAINIITRKGGRTGFHGDASIQTGTFGEGSLTNSSLLSGSYRWDEGFYVNGSVWYQNVRGFNATEDTIRSKIYKTADDDDFRKSDYQLKAGYAKGKWDIFISGKISDQEADIDDRAYDDDDNARLEFERSFLEYHASLSASDKWKITASGSYSRSERLSVNDSSVNSFDGNYDKTYISGKYNGVLMTNELVATHTGKVFDFVGGAGAYREKMYFNTYYYSGLWGPFTMEVNYDSIDTSAETYYAFAHAGLSLDEFNLRGGTRFTRHSTAGNFFTFELNPSYKFGNNLLFASVSSGYNAPSLYQLFDPSSGMDPRISRGNSELEAERSLSFEIGFKKEYNSGSYFTASAYSSSVKNAIEYVYLWNSEVPMNELTGFDYVGDTYLNIPRQQVNGFEFEGRLNLGKFYARGNATVMRGKISVSEDDVSTPQTGGHYVQLYNYGPFLDGDVDINTLVRRPELMTHVEAGFTIKPSLVVYGVWRHAGSRDDVEYDSEMGPYGALAARGVAAYDLADIGATFSFNSRISLHGKIENVADVYYREINGFRTRGRSGYIKLTFRW